jgi:hypothetical protein
MTTDDYLATSPIHLGRTNRRLILILPALVVGARAAGTPPSADRDDGE